MSRPALRSAHLASWRTRWGDLARGVGLDSQGPFLLALSGGADSVFLLHALAASGISDQVVCVHVDHELRGAESRGDRRFCERLSATLGLRLIVCSCPLDARASSLEERAREARYEALFEVARAEGISTILTGHHEDDALETLLLRLLRGSDLAALGGLSARTVWKGRGPAGADLVVVRPLAHLRREEVRCVLADWGLEWREDSSNGDRRFTRNKIRHEVLPWLSSVGGAEAHENLRAFADAVESLEDELARRTAHLAWASTSSSSAETGTAYEPVPGRSGWVPRGSLAGLPPALQRRALWRLVVEGTGRAPSRALLDLLLQDLAQARCTRRSLPGRYSLQLRSDALLLLPPPRALGAWPLAAPLAADESALGRQLSFAFSVTDAVAPAEGAGASSSDGEFGQIVVDGRPLPLPGAIELPDGRRLSAEIVYAHAGAPVPEDPREVELDADGLEQPLLVRWSRPGDRFHPLGAPGSKPLRRFLADAGVPREERDRVPLVFAGTELLWAAGVRPCESRRVRGTTRRRLRLVLRGPDRPGRGAEADARGVRPA